jgi:glycosyltransferase involved in cell wall biosynthesis
LNYLPNREAALWLADVIAPHLRRLVPAVEVAVAGAAPVELIRRLQRAGVNYIEAVPGFAKAYAGSAAVIAPLRGGGGTKFKVLEAWLHGCPVVATTHACRGLGVHPGKHLLQADGPEELAVACAALFTNPALATKIAQAGRAFLTDRFLVPHPDV